MANAAAAAARSLHAALLRCRRVLHLPVDDAADVLDRRPNGAAAAAIGIYAAALSAAVLAAAPREYETKKSVRRDGRGDVQTAETLHRKLSRRGSNLFSFSSPSFLHAL